MLELAYLRENLEEARQRLSHRGFALDIETFQRLDSERKNLIHEAERLRQQRNSSSEEIARLIKDKVDVSHQRSEVKAASQKLKEFEEALTTAEDHLFRFASTV